MALSWGTLLAGALIVFGFPAAVILLNRRKRNIGWWLLSGLVAFIILGNIVEKVTTGTSAIF